MFLNLNHQSCKYIRQPENLFLNVISLQKNFLQVNNTLLPFKLEGLHCQPI